MKYEEELVGQGERAEVMLAIGRSQSIQEKRQKQPCLEPDEILEFKLHLISL